MYRRNLNERREREAHNVATLTGWKLGEIRKKMNLVANESPGEKKWWELW
jgi:hypothetical protein